jgi:hypothetical protein
MAHHDHASRHTIPRATQAACVSGWMLVPVKLVRELMDGDRRVVARKTGDVIRT